MVFCCCCCDTRIAYTYIYTSLVVRGSRPGKQVQLSEDEIKFLCSRAREIFMSQPILLDLEAPIKICGKEPEQCVIVIIIPYIYPFMSR